MSPFYSGYRDTRYQNDTDIGSKTIPDRFQNDTCIGSKMKLSLVSNRYPNNTNPNNTNTTTANRENAVVDFKKLKEYSVKKIEKKLGLLKFKSNIQNPTDWLRAALNNDY